MTNTTEKRNGDKSVIVGIEETRENHRVWIGIGMFREDNNPDTRVHFTDVEVETFRSLHHAELVAAVEERL